MSEKVNIREVLEGLPTDVRKAGRDEICVYMTSKFEPELHVGVRGVDTRVLTADASTTLLERLNAGLRVPRKGDRVLLGHGKWAVTSCDYAMLHICEKQPKPVEPEFRKLEPGEPVMPGDRLVSSTGDYIGPAYNHYKNPDRPRFQDADQSDYQRKPWTPEEYLKRQAEWVEFHNLKPGDTVKVCCKAKNRQDGWGNSWLPCMNGAVGKEFRVEDIDVGYGWGITADSPTDRETWDSLSFPFYVLQVVKKPVPVKPEPKYREFRTPQEVLVWVQEHGQIVANEKGDWATVLSARAPVGGNGQLYMSGVNGIGPTNTLKSHKDGTSFGVLE